MKTVQKGLSLEVIKRFYIAGLGMFAMGLLQMGCSVGSTTGSSLSFSSGNTGQQFTASQMTGHLQQLQSPANKDLYESARAVPLSDMFTNSLSLAPSEPMQLGGHTFDNMHDFLAEYRADLQQISDDYGTVGSYADALGIANLADITPEQIQAGYDMAYKLANQGSSANATTHSSATNAAPDSATSANTATMSLVAQTNASHLAARGRDSGKTTSCVLSAIGAAAASVGAGIVCAATFGLACGAAIVGVAAAGGNAGNNCAQAAIANGVGSKKSGSSSVTGSTPQSATTGSGSAGSSSSSGSSGSSSGSSDSRQDTVNDLLSQGPYTYVLVVTDYVLA